MIKVDEMVNGLYDSEVGNILKMWHEETERTDLRGHSKKLFLKRPRTCLRKNSFVLRVVGTWNGLPSSIVTAPSINSFKNRLDRYWSNQDIMYDDFKAKITESDRLGKVTLIGEIWMKSPMKRSLRDPVLEINSK